MKKLNYLLQITLVALLLFSFGACTEDEMSDQNMSPTVASEIADLSLASSFETYEISLSNVFSDADGDDLVFTASSSDESVVIVEVSTSSLRLIEQADGTSTITVTATDVNGASVSDQFVLTIGDNSTPVVANAISDQTLATGFGAATVELANVFSDADGDQLTYTASSSDQAIVTVSVSGTTLTITEVADGSTEVNVVATDPSGQQVIDTFSVTVGSTSSGLFTFTNQDGNGLTISTWTAIDGADGYVILMNTQDSFTDLTNGDDLDGSTSYNGVGQQLVYNGSSIKSLDITILETDKSYYFKLVPYTGSHVYNHQYAAEEGSTTTCSYSSTSQSEVCFSISGDVRTISANQYPSHAVGNFPNGTPTAIESTHDFDLTPTKAAGVTYVYDETGPPTPSNDNFWQFGAAVNGVEFHPMGLKPWENPDSGEENWEWQSAVYLEGQTDLDAYGAHVTSAGNYHYHGDIVGLADEEDGTRHSLIYGFAADGFPIYYKYGYTDGNDASSAVKELVSSYQLKSGSRPGDGASAPDGSYDGTYIQDFEYVEGLGDLDECNGRTGVTPEYPEGTYYYVITKDFPVTPNCFVGTPNDAWKIGK